MTTYMREVEERLQTDRNKFLSFFLSQDLTRNEKIQQAHRILNENKYSLDAWALLTQDAQVCIEIEMKF